ncbi:type II secretion system F family protein [Methanoregula formicica]|uniref:Archaeal flagella assembly protein J n=1 Tax=Methanoregula formicica (strain DSM 22288 / NBRC 105244 / SMSP) TaxID=593750 RepID=L0HB31_METFS|nr:type II secretion system F family protein [Methanoregula formicica]AGB01962.1 archaeal flagella assembly protein J [Methanoregula formicica SMSP]
MYVPPVLRRAEKRLTDFELMIHGTTLRTTLRSAHLPVTAEEYLRTVRVNLAGTLVMFFTLWFFFVISGLELEIFGLKTTGTLLWLLLFVLIVPGQYAMQMYYPQIIAHGRKSRIDLDLPYAISYMQALSTTMAPYDIIRKVYEEHDMFGEISNEFGIIVRDVELFSDDLNAAIKDLQRITPSTNLRDFMNDLAIVIDSGGNITTYLGAKTEYYRDQAKQEVELVLKTIEIMAEVYVTAFVAGPIALIIMIVAQGMTNSQEMSWILPMMYICIPAGAIVMIWILSLMLPPENLEISRKETVEQHFASGVQAVEEDLVADDDPKNKAFYKRIEESKRNNYYMSLLRHPFRTYIRSYYYGIGLGGIIAGIIAFIWLTGGFEALIPHDQMEAVICLMIIGFMAPVAVSFEGRRWYVRNIEEHLPDFLRELSDMKDIGITLHEAIHRISGAKLGVLSSELSVASRDIESGAYVNSALVKMEERIGLVSVKRAISLLVRASEITTNLKQIFIIAITDFEYYLKLKRERSNTTIIYVMIIYLSFGIYLYTAYQLNVPFLSAFKGMNVNVDTAGNLTEMFRIGIILATFSGIMAGQFSSNSILAGFKHSILLLAATVALFVFLIGA